MARVAPVVALSGALLAGACTPTAPTAASRDDAATSARTVAVRLPAAISVARGLDSLSVSIDPSAFADSTVTVDPGMVLGVESQSTVFPVGGSSTGAGRHGFASGTDFALGADTWSTVTDGVPVPGTKYVGEVTLVLFETDVPAQHLWDPHAGRFKALWTRTLRQAEE